MDFLVVPTMTFQLLYRAADAAGEEADGNGIAEPPSRGLGDQWRMAQWLLRACRGFL
jgi:hypothetical protein